MISRNIDIIAIGALLLGILIVSEVRKSIWVQVMKDPARLRIKHVYVQVPEPPVVPIVFK